MIDIQLTVFVRNGKLVVPYQNEVENMAIEIVGTAEDIFFEKTPINDEFYLEYDDNVSGWVIHNKNKCNCYTE